MAGISTLILGILLILSSLFIDTIWTGGTPGFGNAQWLGLIVGAILIIIGAFKSMKRAA
jgi:hypothetical protein